MVLTALVVQPIAGQELGVTPDEVISVREALLEVLVVDKLGNSVGDLGPEAFRLQQGGRRVAVTTARYYDCTRPTLAASPENPLTPRPESRFFLFLAILAPQNFHRVGEELAAWTRSDLQVWDFVGVASFRHRLVVHSQFTRDRPAAAAAFGSWSSEPALEQREIGLGPELDDLSSALSAIQRRKNLVVIVDSSATFSRSEDWPRLSRALNSSNVAVYVLDLGLSRNARGALRRLAETTTGSYFSRPRDLTIPLDRILLQNRGYYLLSFSPLPKAGSGYERLTVRMRDGRYRALGLPRQRALP